MTVKFKEFNAAKGLAGFDVEASHPSRTSKNALKIGVECVFEDLLKTSRWGKEEYPLVRTDYGEECDSPYIAACPIKGEGIVLNVNMDVKYHCAHTPRSAKDAGLTIDWVNNHQVKATGAFPKIRPLQTLPIALKKADMIANASEDTKKLYLEVLGMELKDMECEYVPSVKKSTFSSNKGIFHIKTTIVELA